MIFGSLTKITAKSQKTPPFFLKSCVFFVGFVKLQNRSSMLSRTHVLLFYTIIYFLFVQQEHIIKTTLLFYHKLEALSMFNINKC